MPSLDFALTWHTNPRKSPVVSFWRPLPPAGAAGAAVVRGLGTLLLPNRVALCCQTLRNSLRLHHTMCAGYRAVGDVMSLGLEPPSAPVPCFRDDVGLRIR